MNEIREQPALHCACCGAKMQPSEAMPSPEGMIDTLRYHADFQACVRVALANLATARPAMRAFLGATE